jgi:phage tail-like protein
MADREDPLVGFHWGIEISNVIKGYFTEVSGIGSENEVIELKAVNDKGQEVVIKQPGRLKWENISLKRGITSSMDIWDWRKQVEEGNVEKARKNGSIVMFNQQLKEVARWNFENAWPVKVTGPQPKSDSNELGIEELQITHEYIVRKK